MKLLTEKPKTRKLRLRLYPYTYVRVCVMKAGLIKKDAYTRLLKMKTGEIARFMQDTEYRKEIDELASAYSGVQLIERALNVNLVRTFLKLKRISEDESLSRLIEAYMIRRDISNIKTILRGKHTKQKEEDIMDLIMPLGLLKGDFYEELVKKDSVEAIAKSLNFIDFSNLRNSLQRYREKGALFELESAIEHDYYSYLLEFSKRIPEQGKFFREFIENEIDMMNIKLVLRLKGEKFRKEDIEKYLFYPGARLNRNDLRKLIDAEDTGAVIKLLQRSDYLALAKQIEGRKESIVAIELKLNKYLLDRAALLMHKNPLSVDVILGYMFAKEIEIKNLKTIIKGRQLGLSEEFIEGELVVGG